MKIIAISDLHGLFPVIEECDTLVLAGDLCPATNHSPQFQYEWLDQVFGPWLAKVPAKHVVGCLGNHDFVGDPRYSQYDIRKLKLRWDYLDCSAVEIEGCRFWGSPWSNWFFEWAFNAPRYDGETFLAELYQKIPENTDIVISHGPAKGFGDLVPDNIRSPNKGEHVGSIALLERLKVVKPSACVVGHIHAGHGTEALDFGQHQITMINASVLNDDYDLVFPPIAYEFQRANNRTIEQ